MFVKNTQAAREAVAASRILHGHNARYTGKNAGNSPMLQVSMTDVSQPFPTYTRKIEFVVWRNGYPYSVSEGHIDKPQYWAPIFPGD